MPLLRLVVILVTALYAGAVWAGDTSLRCGNDIISNGYTMYQVRERCGDPKHEQVIGEIKTLTKEEKNARLQYVTYITEWTYSRDNGIYILTFEGSRLVSKEYIK